MFKRFYFPNKMDRRAYFDYELPMTLYQLRRRTEILARDIRLRRFTRGHWARARAVANYQACLEAAITLFELLHNELCPYGQYE